MIKFFTTCIILMPWIIIPLNNVDMRVPKAMFFDIICIGLIYLGLLKINNLYKNKYFNWLILWLFIIIFFNFLLIATLKNMIKLCFIQPMFHVILGIWATHISMSCFNKDDYIKIAKAICISATLVCLYGIMQLIGLDPYGKIAKGYIHPNHFCALLDNPNLMGNFFCLSAPFFLLFNKWKYKIGFALIIVGLVLSRSEFSLLACFVGLTIFAILSFRNIKTYYYAIAFWLTSTLLILSNFKYILGYYGGFNGRLECWKIAYTYLKDNPLFGQGFGIWSTWRVVASTETWKEVHCDWLQLAIEIGILGLILIGLVLFNSFKNFNYRDKLGCCFLASFVSFLILMCASFPVYYAPTALLGLIGFWGIEYSRKGVA